VASEKRVAVTVYLARSTYSELSAVYPGSLGVFTSGLLSVLTPSVLASQQFRQSGPLGQQRRDGLMTTVAPNRRGQIHESIELLLTF
jgi:hypothetical protein